MPKIPITKIIDKQSGKEVLIEEATKEQLVSIIEDGLTLGWIETGETQKSISKWADETFGPAPNLRRMAVRCAEEMQEFILYATRLYTSIGPSTEDEEHLIKEAADVVITLFRLARNMGFDLLDEVDKKMAINRKRRWKLDGTGHGYHIKEE